MKQPLITELLPHTGPMVLLDRFVQADAEQLQALVEIRPDSLFCQAAPGTDSSDGGVGAWVGIEYMAQAIAAWAGFQSRQRGEPVSIGFLLGTRRYACSVPSFAIGRQLLVTARMLLQADNGLGSFDCSICDAATKEELAQASVSVFQPHDAKQYLEESTT